MPGLNNKQAEVQKFTIKMQKKLVILFLFVLLAFVGLSVRLILITKEDGERYKKQVLSQQKYSSTTIPYKRGAIVDAKGTNLAISEKVYNVILDVSLLLDKETYLEPTMKALVNCFGLNESELRAYVVANPESKYYPLKKQLTYEEITPFLELQKEKETGKLIQGIWFEDEYKRKYPNNMLACDVLGFTGSDNNGMFGLEEYYNDVLNGTNGRQYGYLNDDASLERSTRAAVDGNTIVSTLDANIQAIVEKHINAFNAEHKGEAREGEDGSKNIGVIIMNPQNGEIMAMGSSISFDPNNPYDLTSYFPAEEIEVMTTDQRYEKLNEIWRNFCIFDTYEPGSTAKTFTMATGLEYGNLTGNESYDCHGVMEVSGHNITCHKKVGHGPISFSQSLEESCNVAMMQMSALMGKEIFMEGLANFNFGLKTNIDLVGEARTASLIYPVETMVASDLAISSFGQGYNVTMIQLAAAFSSSINGGYYYMPHMVSKILGANGSVVENIEPRVIKQTVSSATTEKMKEYLYQTVARGTAKTARPAGYEMGGKTGTAERSPRDNTNYVVSFIGYAPLDDPQVVIYTVIDRPNVPKQDMATYATKLSKDIMTEVLPYLNIFMTLELTEEEKAELEALKITWTKPIGQDPLRDEEGNLIQVDEKGEPVLDEEGNPIIVDEEGNPISVSGNEVEEPEAEPEEVDPMETFEKDPETGNPIDPTTGAILDPETGETIESTSNLGGL